MMEWQFKVLVVNALPFIVYGLLVTKSRFFHDRKVLCHVSPSKNFDFHKLGSRLQRKIVYVFIRYKAIYFIGRVFFRILKNH